MAIFVKIMNVLYVNLMMIIFVMMMMPIGTIPVVPEESLKTIVIHINTQWSVKNLKVSVDV